MKNAFLMGLAFAGLMSSAAFAQAPAQPAAPPPAPGQKAFGDWIVRCGGPAQTPCEMMYAVAKKDTGQPLLVVTMVYVPSRDIQIMQIALPLGVAIAKGVTMKTSTFTSAKLPYQRCENTGCFVILQVNNESLETFKKAEPKGTITVNVDGDGKDMSLNLSFKGFNEANAYLVEQAKARGGKAAPAAADPSVINGQ